LEDVRHYLENEMKRSDDNIGNVESITTIIVNIGTIAWWIFSIFTAFVLTSQPQPITLPGFLELGPRYKLVFLLSILLGYIQLLKRSWEQQKRRGKDIEGSLGGYIYCSTVKGKRPLVLIGFLSILGVVFALVFTEIIPLAVILVFVVPTTVIMFFLYDGWTTVKRNYDDDYRKRWLKRIRNQLYQDGSTNTFDFLNLPDSTISEINWAITLYFELHEFDKDLIFDEGAVERNNRRYNVCEIRFKHVSSSFSS
jgi:hypothetical protein